MEALERARRDVPRVVRKFITVSGITQEQLGAALGFSQRQMSRRLCVPGALAQEEVAAIAAYFRVPIETLHKPVPEAVRDLLDSGATLDSATRVLLESAGQLVGVAA
ncbi:MAG TPA: helix-turn-helix transcriptional regulator [Acidimicrobiales bacterium]|nr:helix-turn-helix transcriptional regulator [Acidimicrobiales bacterium]